MLEREFNKLLYGDHPLVWEETKASIERISQSDLFDFHSKYFAPNNIILAVAGDFNRSEMLRKIEDAFLNWPKKEIRFPKVPPVIEKNRPGVFMIQKDINQGYVNVGHFGIKDTNPDLFAVNLMNFILGGGSFTSRITSKVRSDEGLAYNTGSRFATEHDFPGTFYGYVQTKSATVHYAISLILNEFKRIQKELVSDQELETAKNYYLDSFPDRFSSAIGTMISFANLEYDGFPMDYYDTFREKYQAVTKQDILRVAKKYIKPGEMSIFVVGDIEKCKAGDEKHPGTLDQLGKIVEIKLGDPLAGE
ncbi:MAG: insulinase family protein [candidate division KSB1 bacterium]|nr:insulinase family protein [candidate division KSB1 bacterium]